MHYLAPLSNEDQDHASQSTVTVQRHEAQRVIGQYLNWPNVSFL